MCTDSIRCEHKNTLKKKGVDRAGFTVTSNDAEILKIPCFFDYTKNPVYPKNSKQKNQQSFLLGLQHETHATIIYFFYFIN